MKKILIVLSLLLCTYAVNAQAFKAKNLNLDLGYAIGSHRGAFYSPGVLFNVEKGVHKWIGVGAYAGYQYNFAARGFWWGGVGTDAHSIVVGGLGSFHFYQMISDLVGKEISSDKLDVFIKHSLGVRMDIGRNNSNRKNKLTPHFDWGTSLNARYFFTDAFGVYAEVGYAALGNVVLGVAFKF